MEEDGGLAPLVWPREVRVADRATMRAQVHGRANGRLMATFDETLAQVDHLLASGKALPGRREV